ncbi:hypothetical protein FA15DRAFT_698219 [Coprinopsis marcescibilis]|uniref:Uncharacterized protein n=1 Tax=Coprinopsis marcescibilis TaxID=230819 RepID=A0A5C3KEI0_COPMA|nr:hypothetical protein FA15DRAFT_698219 [Coprinopsis marcescibilis]
MLGGPWLITGFTVDDERCRRCQETEQACNVNGSAKRAPTAPADRERVRKEFNVAGRSLRQRSTLKPPQAHRTLPATASLTPRKTRNPLPATTDATRSRPTASSAQHQTSDASSSRARPTAATTSFTTSSVASSSAARAIFCTQQGGYITTGTMADYGRGQSCVGPLPEAEVPPVPPLPHFVNLQASLSSPPLALLSSRPSSSPAATEALLAPTAGHHLRSSVLPIPITAQPRHSGTSPTASSPSSTLSLPAAPMSSVPAATIQPDRLDASTIPAAPRLPQESLLLSFVQLQETYEALLTQQHTTNLLLANIAGNTTKVLDYLNFVLEGRMG